MKKILIFFLFSLSLTGFGQTLPLINVGKTANDGTGDALRTAFIKTNAAITRVNTLSKAAYPGAGIPLSTGSAWGSSITNNSTNWNTAYGWGNHAGLYDPVGTGAGAVGTHESTYNHTNYNTAYTDRLKWDGGSTGLVAATGRTSLGGTTVGQSIFTLTNPSAITFLRMNADNTVTALSAANFKTALSLVSADVSLGNVTNKAQVEVEDSAAMLASYARELNPTFYTGISTPAITLGATDLQSLLDDKAPIVNTSLTGTTNVAKLQIGDATSNTIVPVDSAGYKGTDVALYIGPDTVNVYIPASRKVTLASVIGDYTTSWDSTYIHRRVDSLVVQVNNQKNEIDAIWNAIALLSGVTDVIPPKFLSAEIGTYSDDTVHIVFDEVLANSVPATTDFVVTEDGIPLTINSVTLSNDTVFLKLSTPAIAGYDYLVDYTKGVDPLQDADDNETPNWIDKPITNNLGFTAEYQVIYDAFTFKPDGPIANAQDVLVDSLTTYGGNYLSRMDQLFVFATSYNNGDEALINWVSPGTLDGDNLTGTLWTALEGYTGNGIDDDIIPNFNLNDNGVNYTLDDGSIGIYTRLNIQGTGNSFGAYDATNRTSLSPRNTSDQYTARINITSGTTMQGSNTNSSGLFILTRTASNVCSLYRAGSLVETEADVSTAIPDAWMLILTTSGVGGFYSANQASIWFIMDGVSATEAAQLDRFFETYMDAIGKGVE